MSQNVHDRHIEWINAARAICIFLVVMLHASLYLPMLEWPQREEVIAVWDIVSAIFQPIRMPLFFLISGFLASRSILDERPDARRKRLFRPLYLYVLWAALFMVLMPFDPTVGPVPRSLELSAVWVLLIASPAWYFFALGFYFAIAKIAAKLPVLVTLSGALLLAILAEQLKDQLVGQMYQLARCAIFFLAGARLKCQIEAFVPRANLSKVVLPMLAYVGLLILPTPFHLFGPVVSMVGVMAAMLLVGYLSVRFAVLSRLLSPYGRNTLAIYIFHFPIVSYASFLLASIVRDSRHDLFIGVTIFPVAITMLAVLLSLKLYGFCKYLGADWLFDLSSFGKLSLSRRALSLDK